MTDREALLIAYGVLNSHEVYGKSLDLIDEHLFPKHPPFVKRSDPIVHGEPMDAFIAPAIAAVEKIIAKTSPPEEKPSTPGDYRLKRHILGPVGLKLSECDWKKLKAGIAKYRDAMALGPVHPEAVKDVEAAELYLESDFEQKYRGKT